MARYSVSSLHKSYGEKIVLEDFSAVFDPERANIITGPSGCGKTTLIRIICGLEKPDFGEIHGFAGASFAVMFQEDRLFSRLNPVKNVAVALNSAANNEKIIKDLISVGFAEDDLKKPAASLSGGMARRAALVRAVSAESGVLILDEPFKGLDGKTRGLAVKYLAESLEKKPRLFIAITHSPSEFASFDTHGINF